MKCPYCKTRLAYSTKVKGQLACPRCGYAIPPDLMPVPAKAPEPVEEKADEPVPKPKEKAETEPVKPKKVKGFGRKPK